MPTLSYGGWQIGVNLGSLLKRARVHARLADYEQMAQGSTDDQYARVAEIVNESLADWYTGNKALGEAVWTSALPTTGWQLMQGTVATTNLSATLTGTNTEFLTDMTDSSTFIIGGTSTQVASVSTNTSATLSSAATATASGMSIYKVADSALSRNIAIPTDLFQQDILEVQLTSSTNTQLQSVPFIDRPSLAALASQCPWLINGSITQNVPDYWSFNEERIAMEFYPFPDLSTVTIRITYRRKPTTITGANIGTPDSVTIGEVPTLCMNQLALRIAAFLALPVNRDLASELMQQYDFEKAQFQKQARQQIAAMQRGGGNQARPNGIINQNSIFRWNAYGRYYW